MRAMKKAMLATAALLVCAAAGVAQAPGGADARWRAMVGCWAPEGVAAAVSAVCVVPAGASGVELVTVANGRVESRERVETSGAKLPSTRDKCAGWDQGRWSPDGRRVYLRSEHTCDGVAVRSTGVLALAPEGVLIDVRGVSLAGGPPDVRMRRYYEASDWSALPRELHAELAAAAPGEMLLAAARASAAAPLTIADVVEASREVDARVLEAFLIERGQRFDVDAKRLVAMADAGVPSGVIDLVVALSHPGRFVVSAPDREAALRERERVATTLSLPASVSADRLAYGRRSDLCYDPLYAPIPFYPLYASSDCVGYRPYGWGRSAWGYGYGYPYYAGGAVIAVRQLPNGSSRSGGRVVKGKGYSTGSTDGDRTAHPRSTGSSADRTATSSQPSSSGSAGSTSAGSTSAGSTSSGSSGGTERTAKPRDP